jgi:hypothetical protein
MLVNFLFRYSNGKILFYNNDNNDNNDIDEDNNDIKVNFNLDQNINKTILLFFNIKNKKYLVRDFWDKSSINFNYDEVYKLSFNGFKILDVQQYLRNQ